MSVRQNMFMITCAARTGSSLMVSYLQSHPNILCHGEIYAPDNANALLGVYNRRRNAEIDYGEKLVQYRDNHPHTFLYKVAFDCQDREFVGFKLKHDELVLPSMAETRHLIQEDTDIKIIHLRRENLLARYLSWYLVNHVTGVTMRIKGEELPKHQKVTLDPQKCLSNFEEAMRRYNFFKKMFSSHQVFEVTYEQLTGDNKTKIIQDIQDFLGVERSGLKTKMVKIGKKDLSETIENFDELKLFFGGTVHEIYFD